MSGFQKKKRSIELGQKVKKLVEADAHTKDAQLAKRFNTMTIVVVLVTLVVYVVAIGLIFLAVART